MVGARREFGHDVEIGAKETCAELGDQFFAGALAASLRVAAEVAIDTVRWRGPMHLMPISA